MIAVDTNVLVRYVTNDDPDQARKAMAVLAQNDAILVTHTVLLELGWVLRSAYGIDPAAIGKALRHILGLPKVHVEEAERIALALSWYAHGMDFADALHLALASDCERLVTLDRHFAKIATAHGLPVELL